MRNFSQVNYEGIVVGIVVAIVGILISKLITKGSHPKFDSPYLITMIIGFVLTGYAVHLLFEYSGVNQKFCEIIIK
jgi:H+/Cl- antiporter ClcA